MRLEGKKAVVTGAGRGIGAAIARELVGEGARVVLAARNAEELEILADQLGSSASVVLCDVCDPESVSALAATARERLGNIDILVNNAGIATSAPVRALSLEEWNRHMNVNATGTFLCSKAFLNGMVEAKWGRIVNVASVAGRSGGKYLAAYAASKHAVLGLTRSLADEVALSGVTVNAVCPGFVNTELTRKSVARIMLTTGRTEAEALQTLTKLNPQARLIEPEEVAYLVLCLCDPRALGINGQALVLDGGGLLS